MTSANLKSPSRSAPVQETARVFFIAFLASCFLFWWLPSVLYWATGQNDPVRASTLIVSFAATLAFSLGYFRRPIRFRQEIPALVMDRCENIAWKATILLALPALLIALYFISSRAGVAYGEGQGLSAAEQVVLYSHMFFGFLYLGAMRERPRYRYRFAVASLAIILPRLVVSLRWGRFFVAQAVVPILFIALARGWIRLSAWRWLQFAALALAIIFIPSLTRGDLTTGQEDLIGFFASGSTLKLYQDNSDLNLNGRCPPLLVSLTDGFVPYGVLGKCTIDVWGRKNLAATLDRILAYNDPATEGTLEGPGANYLLELYLSGGLVVVLIGSALFGFTSKCLVTWIGRRSLFAGIWAECLSRTLLAPRGTLGYVYQLVPILIVSTLVVALIAYSTGGIRTVARDTGQTENTGTGTLPPTSGGVC